MSSLLPSFLRGNTGTMNNNANTINPQQVLNNQTGERGSGAGVRRSSGEAPNTAASRRPSAPAVISKEEWQRKLKAVNLSPNDLNALVMNYLVIEGYKEAAEQFARESNCKSSANLTGIEERMQIRNAIQRGDVTNAIDRIIDFDVDLLDSNARLAFRLQQQLMIELVREGRMEEALEFAQEELAPRAEDNIEFLKDLERTMSLLVFVDGQHQNELLHPSHRVKVANEVNAALLALQSQDNESRLPVLLKDLFVEQENLSRKCVFPKITDPLAPLNYNN